MPWYAIYTKSRNEKKVTQGLVKMGITAYCPVVSQVHQWSDRKKKVETPLIPSYVFVNLDEKDRAKVFAVPGVVRYLYWLGKPAVITDAEIAALKRSLERTIQKYEVQQYQPGDKIMIPSGPFQGKEAEVTEIQDKKVHLVLEGLGMRITLHLNDSD